MMFIKTLCFTPSKNAWNKLYCLPAIIAWLLLLGLVSQQATSAPLAVKCKDIYAPENLLAWCIVPFDAKKRGPEERAQMLHRLGIHCLAYDWREEHIPTFEAEVEAMQRHHIELTAWWFPNTLDANANAILGVIEKYKITPQLWVTGGGEMLQPGNAHDAHVLTEANRIKPIAEAADKLGCQVALYNHGGWFGEPENQLDVISQLATEGIKNVGIVYNFHHGHAHLPRFGELVRKMKPHLLAVNLNGMVRNGDKTNTTILPLGTGDQELEMLRVLQASGWRGVVGIIDHKQETDSEVTLKENLQGLQWLRSELQRQGSGGAKPSVVATTVAAGAETRAPEPAAFFPDAVPLRPADHPFYEARVNRDRIYDFYAKQALHFGPMTPQPDIVPSFAGLDGGRYGHWGNQNEELWRDTSWNDMDAGGMQSGIIAIGGENVPRGVCVQLGEQRELAACFNTDTLTWEGVWSGGKLLHFDSYRWGMMAALALVWVRQASQGLHQLVLQAVALVLGAGLQPGISLRMVGRVELLM